MPFVAPRRRAPDRVWPCLLGAALLAASGGARAELVPLDGAGSVPPPWRFAGLPDQKLPATRYDVVDLDGRRVLRVAADGAYGNLVHPASGRGGTLRWSWRMDRLAAGSDLRKREGDDAALKVCAMFELPLEAVPFWERQGLRLARSLSGEALPAATLCYVWDARLPPGTVLRNVYTARMRWIVLQGAGSTTGQWRDERRDLAADFLRAFGDEASTVPPLQAIAVGADTDNTGSSSLAYLSGLQLEPAR